MELYTNLPGYRTTLRDGGLRVTPPDPNTDSVLLLGTSRLGPLNEPVRIRTQSELNEVLGEPFDDRGRHDKSTLYNAVIEAMDAGCEDVRVMRISGEHAEVKLNSKVPNIVKDEYILTLAQVIEDETKVLEIENVEIGFQEDTDADGFVETNTTLSKQYEGIADILKDHLEGFTVKVQGEGDDEEIVMTAEEYYQDEMKHNADDLININIDKTEVAEDYLEKDIMLVRANEPGELFNQTKEDVIDGIRIEITDDKKMSVYVSQELSGLGLPDTPDLMYDLTEFNIDSLIEEINTHDPANEWINVFGPESLSDELYDPEPKELYELDAELMAQVDGPKTYNLEGGDDGLDIMKPSMSKRKNHYKKLEQAYSLITNYDVDIVVPVDAYADEMVEVDGEEKQAAFAQQLANFCAMSSDSNSLTLGVIATSPLPRANTPLVNEYFNELTENKFKDEFGQDMNFYLLDENGNRLTDDQDNIIDAGKFLSIVAGEGIIDNPEIGRYSTTLESAYAGRMSNLQPHSSTTNKPIPGVNRIRYEFSPKQLDTLTGKRFVTMRQRVGGEIVVTDGITRAEYGSDYSRLTTVRIVSRTSNVAREVSEPFIGEAMGKPERTALRSEIREALEDLKDQGMLRDFAFTVESTPREKIQGIARINLELVPAFELRRIRTVVQLRPEL